MSILSYLTNYEIFSGMCCLFKIFPVYIAVSVAVFPVFGQTTILPGNPKIKYEGRVFVADTVASLYWPGSSIKIRFKGERVAAILKDERGRNYYSVILDKKHNGVVRLDSTFKYYEIYSGENSEHELQIFRRNGYTGGTTSFYGFRFDGPFELLPPVENKRRIEFYGNSITVGSGMYENRRSEFGGENNYNSYAAITARHFGASYTCIARPGIGLLVSWFPMTMPELFTRENPSDSTSRWDFSKNVPDIVVINLFQNDCAIIQSPASSEFKMKFNDKPPSGEDIVRSYRQFINNIRSLYPSAHIICTLGNMDAVSEGSPWPGYIAKAVSSVNDPKMYTHFFKYKNTPGHPDEKEHVDMAQSLIRFIENNIKW